MKGEHRATGQGMQGRIRGCSALIILLGALLFFPPPACASGTGDILAPSEIQIRQAHMSWRALAAETEMNAAITYIFPLYETDTTQLNALLAEFREQGNLIAGASKIGRAHV